MLALYKRGRLFWIRGSVRGQRIRKSLDTEDRQEALERRREWERELWTGKRARPFPWPGFAAEFLQSARPRVKPSSLRKYEFVTTRFGDFVGKTPLSQINSATIAAYQQNRQQDPGLGIEGLKSDLRILHGVFAYALHSDYIESNPVPYHGLNSRSRNTQPFSREEVERMLAHALEVTSPIPNATPPRADLPVIIQTFVGTGLRISDICGLLRSEVDLKSGQIIKRTQKRDKVVAIPLHPQLLSALRSHLKSGTSNPDSPFVFPTSTGRKTLPETLDAILRRLWKRAGIPGAHAHRYRDTFAVRLLEQGASLYDVAQLLGISTAVCERHYAPWVQELQDRSRKYIEAAHAGRRVAKPA